jgi:uncharacterized surface protein with fasciclin (FAS1) repeats
VTPSPVASLSFQGIIDSDPVYSTLSQALDAAEFDIETVDFPSTLFAPNNGAFASLDPTFLDTLFSLGWRAHLFNILRGHLVGSAIRPSSLVDGVLTALNGEILTVSVGDVIEISSSGTDGAVVSLPEVLSSNGVFYELNKVLLPSFVNVTVSDILTSPDLSILNDLLMLTGLDQLFASRRRIQAMTNGTASTFTVFAPNNNAFTALGVDAMEYFRSNVDVTRTLLLGHIVFDRVVSTRSLNGSSVELQSEAGDTLTFMSDFRDDGTPTYTVNDVEIMMSDVLAYDGIVQVIGSVLTVSGADLPDFDSDTPSSFPSASPMTNALSPVSNAPSPVTSAPSLSEPPSDGATKDNASKGMGMMYKKDMVKSKKMEKVGKSSKKGKSSGKGKGSGNSGKGKGSDTNGKNMVPVSSVDKGKRPKACDESQDIGHSSKGKGRDGTGKGSGIRGKKEKKGAGIDCNGPPTVKGMRDKMSTKNGRIQGSGKTPRYISPKGQTEDD